MEISPGLDENIRVRRSSIKEFTKKKFLSKDIQEEKAWKIEVTNGKSVPIQLELIDQYPISKNGAIKVDLKSHDNGMLNEETGEIKWILTIPATQSATKTVRYEVRHPKNKMVIID